jgi:hypothetical protein
MQKQFGKIGTVRHRYARAHAHGSGGITLDVPSATFAARESRVCVLSQAGPSALASKTTPVKNNVRNIRSDAPVLPEKQTCVISTAGVAAHDEPTTVLETYREHDMRTMQNISAIITMPFVAWQAWRAYRTHLRQRQSTVQMLALSCVLRPVDVELRYITPLPKVGVCIGAPDAQSSHDMEFSLYLEPSTSSMRARGTQLLHWLQHEWTATCMPKVRAGVAAGRRWWILLLAQVYKANSRRQQEEESDAIIRLLKTQRLQPW